MKILLANGCARSEVSVTPKNWKKTTSIKKDWLIYYRFYCPGLTGEGTKYPKGKLVPIRGMNEYRDIAHRRSFTIALVGEIEKDLDKCEYNPITGYRKDLFDEENIDYEISPDMPMIEAWSVACEKMTVSAGVKLDLKSVRKYSEIAAKNLKIDHLPVRSISRRHMKALLDQLGIVKGNKWTANTYNYYRAHLSMIYAELCEWETIDNNPMEKIKKMDHAVRKRPTLSKEQKIQIDQDLRQNHYRFWLLTQLFFYSGARETELIKVKYEDVHLDIQEVTYKILKGKARYENRPIPANAIHLWQQALVGAKKGMYLFCEDLMPGFKPMTKDNAFTRNWKKFVKDKVDAAGNKVYGEEVADIYSLKHTHSSMVSKIVGTKLAALHNRHTEAVLKQNYDTEGEDRNMEILKGLEVSFV